MSKSLFIALGVALLCALPIVGTVQSTDTPGHRTARQEAPKGSIGVYKAPPLQQRVLQKL